MSQAVNTGNLSRTQCCIIPPKMKVSKFHVKCIGTTTKPSMKQANKNGMLQFLCPLKNSTKYQYLYISTVGGKPMQSSKFNFLMIFSPCYLFTSPTSTLLYIQMCILVALQETILGCTIIKFNFSFSFILDDLCSYV